MRSSRAAAVGRSSRILRTQRAIASSWSGSGAKLPAAPLPVKRGETMFGARLARLGPAGWGQPGTGAHTGLKPTTAVRAGAKSEPLTGIPTGLYRVDMAHAPGAKAPEATRRKITAVASSEDGRPEADPLHTAQRPSRLVVNLSIAMATAVMARIRVTIAPLL